MQPVCFDTHILIWGIEKTSRLQQQDMILKTEVFLKHLDERNIVALIPTVVISEFLMSIPVKTMERYVNLIEERFMIVPYDAIAAIEFAKIWQAKHDDHTVQSLKNENFSRSHLKVDSMIIATAVTQKVSCIYSHDPGLKKMAYGYVEVKEVPSIPR